MDTLLSLFHDLMTQYQNRILCFGSNVVIRNLNCALDHTFVHQ